MKGNEYLRYVTEQVVTYMDLPKEEKIKRKELQYTTSDAYKNRWLGLLPFTVKLWYKKRNGK